MFSDHLSKILDNSNFWQTWLYSFMWNLQSRKFQAFIVATIFFMLNIFNINLIDENTYLIVLGIYMGSNIVDKISYKIGAKK